MSIRSVGPVLPPLAVVGISFLILPLAIGAPIIGLVGLVLLIGLSMLLTLGIERTSIVLLILGFFAAPMPAVTIGGITSITLADVFIVAAFGVRLPILLRRRVPIPSAFVIGSFIFVVAGLLASLGQHDDPVSYGYFIKVIVINLILPVLILWWAPRGRTLIALPAAYVAGTCLSMVDGLVKGSTYAGRMTGLTFHPNAFAYTVMLSIYMLPFLWLVVRQQERKFVVVAGVMALAGVWFSGGRFALLGVIILAILLPALERSVTLAMGVAFVGILIVANTNFSEQAANGDNALARLLGGGGAAQSNQAREQGLSVALDKLRARPLLGFGFQKDTFGAHNIYLIVAVSVGFIGLIGFLLVLWSMVNAVILAPKPLSYLSLPALAFVFVGPITPNLTDRYLGVPVALALLAHGLTTLGPDEDEQEPGANALIADAGPNVRTVT